MLLIEHRKENYPEGMYRQPRDAFWHVAEFSDFCSLCDYDADREAVARMDDEKG